MTMLLIIEIFSNDSSTLKKLKYLGSEDSIFKKILVNHLYGNLAGNLTI